MIYFCFIWRDDFHFIGERTSRGSAKFYAGNSPHSYEDDAGANLDSYNQHSQQRNSHQSNYHQYHQPPPGSNQSTVSSRKTQRSNQPIPKISITSNPVQHQNSAHNSSGNVGLVKQFESVNIWYILHIFSNSHKCYRSILHFEYNIYINQQTIIDFIIDIFQCLQELFIFIVSNYSLKFHFLEGLFNVFWRLSILYFLE